MALETADRSPAPASLPGWAVHLLTASGAVLALLALAAIDRQSWREALLWLLLALVIDGVDGSLARAARVTERVPRIDGAALDLIIDYLNYVLVPTLFMWRADLLPEGFELALASLILLSSLYVFVRRDMKTEDGYFRGFPALWNIVALYLYVSQPHPWTGGAVVLVLVALTFAPILVIHPFRSLTYGRWTAAVAAVWGISTAALLLPGLAAPQTQFLLLFSLSSAALLFAFGAIRTVRARRSQGLNSAEE